MSEPAQKLQPPAQSQSGQFRERRGVPAMPPRRIAHIVSVSGARAVAVLERTAGASKGDYARVQIGALVKITTPASSAVGWVTAVSMPMPSVDGDGGEVGLIELNLVGEIVIDGVSRRLAFRRGVSSLPSIGDPVLLADRHDLTRVYAPPSLATVQVGTLFQDAAVPARLLVDDLLAKHFVVVGSTGAGKSCALTCILQRVLEDHKHAHIVVMDIHNEYVGAFGDKVEAINAQQFQPAVLAVELPGAGGGLDHRRRGARRRSRNPRRGGCLGQAPLFRRRQYARQRAGAQDGRQLAHDGGDAGAVPPVRRDRPSRRTARQARAHPAHAAPTAS